MNIASCYDLHELIKQLEIALMIEDGDLRETNMDNLIKNVKTKIDRQYQINLTDCKLNDMELEISEAQEAASTYIANIARLHSMLCGYCQIRRYLATTDISLEDINYLGLTRESLKESLKALQRACYQPRLSDFLEILKRKLPTISNSWEKRLFVLVVVCEELGLPEVAACIGEILYQSFRK